jgi:PPOX class probable F420-dependent enzyme
MTAELERAVKRYKQWFGTYKKSGELKLIEVWLTVNDGSIEFLTPGDSYKVKRLKNNPKVVCHVGSKDGPTVTGTAEVITDKTAMDRVYRAYRKTHLLLMLLLGRSISRKVKDGTQVLIRVRPDDPDLLKGVTDPIV